MQPAAAKRLVIIRVARTMAQLGKQLFPPPGTPAPIRIDLADLGMNLKPSEQCLRDLEELRRERVRAWQRCRHTVFD